MNSILSLIIFLFSFNIFASDFTSDNKKGFWITPEAASQNQLMLKNGDDFNFNGAICVVRWGGALKGNGKNDKNNSNQCLKVPNSKLVFKAYFPDSLHDVSDKLIITQSNDKKSWTYSLKTDKLKSTDLNQFTLTIGTDNKKSTQLLAVKAKLEKRILILQGFKSEYIGNDLYKENLVFINNMISYLQGLVVKINSALDTNPDVIAQMRQPLQVGNIVSAPRLTKQRSPASVTNYTYDSVNFLSQINHQNRNTLATLTQFDYVRDSIGNITKMTSMKGDFNFTYDNNNQLINATHPEDSVSSFTYDSLGNRITDQFGNFNYDNKKQRLLEDWKYQYAYDNNGNLSSKILKSDNSKVTHFIHNSENQLISIREYDGANVVKETKYFYDVLGRRIKKESVNSSDSSKSFTRKYLYDGQEILFELDESNNLLSTFTHSGLRTDDVLAVDKSGTSYFYLKDHLGTVNDIINSSGNLVQHYVYSPFGKIVRIENASGTDITATPMVDNFYTFTGREYDKESGLYYYRARYLDSETGRFIQVDPVAGVKDDPLTVNNKYIYTKNSPAMLVDPKGEFWEYVAAIVIATVASFYDSENKNGDITIGGKVNFNEYGQYSSTEIYTQYGRHSIYYNTSAAYESWVTRLSEDAGGLANTYPDLGLAGAYGLTVTEFSIWMRGYPNAGGGGIGLDYAGENVIRADWHKWKPYLENVPKKDRPYVNRPHIDSDMYDLEHWPW